MIEIVIAETNCESSSSSRAGNNSCQQHRPDWSGRWSCSCGVGQWNSRRMDKGRPCRRKASQETFAFEGENPEMRKEEKKPPESSLSHSQCMKCLPGNGRMVRTLHCSLWMCGTLSCSNCGKKSKWAVRVWGSLEGSLCPNHPGKCSPGRVRNNEKCPSCPEAQLCQTFMKIKFLSKELLGPKSSWRERHKVPLVLGLNCLQ
ncbi:uncharacterized protein LOC126649480 [Myiozetetes cayanensis]|uniref:uncharacterized protein LOC126649480 n=1 Tax=Myiozetetes cayanensis TaxID=478635 RepID=UPI002160C545|nr:uncharacterized protein LOC126649480 [Myiozetetes cayanensis]